MASQRGGVQGGRRREPGRYASAVSRSAATEVSDGAARVSRFFFLHDPSPSKRNGFTKRK